ENLHKQLETKNRVHWVEEEMEILTTPDTYENPPENAWERIKIRSDKSEVLAVLRALAHWREEKAIKKNIPRGHILKDDTLADIALYMPRDVEGLKQIRSLPSGITNGATGKLLLDLIAKARKTPKDTWPAREGKKPFPKEKTATLEMLKLLLKINCAEADVAPKLIANAKDLEKLVLKQNPNSSIMKGWRYDIFGKDAAALMAGKIMLTLEDDKIKKVQI
ncbi:MAG: HRDC domain-containing protein, partial [Alphaproteobacteria bacterium]|nr:HRDC domain-containing protein [Alphaproteobacteria bacterium]